MDEVKDLKPTNDLKDLVNQMSNVGFQATHVAEAVRIIKKMKTKSIFSVIKQTVF